MSDYEIFKTIAGILKDKNTNEYTKDDVEHLSKSGVFRKDEVEFIASSDLFKMAVADQLQNATRRLKTSIKSPYQTDKDLGLDLEDGLSSIFPVNSRCVTFEIKGENSVGYLSVNPNGSMVEIFKSGGVIEDFTVSESNRNCILKKVSRDYEFQQIDIEKAIKKQTST